MESLIKSELTIASTDFEAPEQSTERSNLFYDDAKVEVIAV